MGRDRIAIEEPRQNSLTGLSPAFPDRAAPIRTAKAERRYQERLRVQSPDLPIGRDKELSPAERRALEAEKRAMWRAARNQALEDDLKQYEQDRARRLYQSRQRAAEGAGPAQRSSVKHLPLARQEPPYTDFRCGAETCVHAASCMLTPSSLQLPACVIAQTYHNSTQANVSEHLTGPDKL
ncbi:protein scribble homolog [Scyliorhinus canicula]|uniref:protein scribble homolog n=1 Tax=Scyliorhinus canicula TaxID=7830 RepID=UPI0018F3B180|nr:protein scribble homolog [Scyliorhinus canicula]